MLNLLNDNNELVSKFITNTSVNNKIVICKKGDELMYSKRYYAHTEFLDESDSVVISEKKAHEIMSKHDFILNNKTCGI